LEGCTWKDAQFFNCPKHAPPALIFVLALIRASYICFLAFLFPLLEFAAIKDYDSRSIVLGAPNSGTRLDLRLGFHRRYLLAQVVTEAMRTATQMPPVLDAAAAAY